MSEFDTDIVIVGGGLVGMALAAAFADLPFKVSVVERREGALLAQPVESDDDFDERSLVLSRVSISILNELGVWDDLLQQAAPIEHVHVSEQYRIGVTRLHAADSAVDAFGYVTGLRSIGRVLQQRLAGQKNLEWIDAARCTDFSPSESAVTVSLDVAGEARVIRSRLLLIADGSDSQLRAITGAIVDTADYHQQALVTNVEAEGMPSGWAFERFTAKGPAAFLPLPDGRYSVVWTGASEVTEARLALSDSACLSELQGVIGSRAGRLLRLGKRESFPLRQVRASRMAGLRYALVGNAAHTLHPVAGQGFNLALRDVALLRQQLSRCVDPGNKMLLQYYNDTRLEDVVSTSVSTDALVRLFNIQGVLPSHLRSLALLGLDCVPGVKRRIARYGMGFRSGLAPIHLRS